tara:strand:- start:55 stop:501 length:447 start_codon:yes stop_codon:yes gene_type:complete
MAKRRTAKQKAATRKLVALNRRRKRSTRKGGVRKTARRAYMGIRKTTRKRRKSATIKRRKPRRTMRRGLKSITSGSTVKKVALGLGGAAMASAVVAAVAPQFSRVAAPAGAYFLGGIEGVIGNFAFDFLKGRTGGGTAANASPAMEVL